MLRLTSLLILVAVIFSANESQAARPAWGAQAGVTYLNGTGTGNDANITGSLGGYSLGLHGIFGGKYFKARTFFEFNTFGIRTTSIFGESLSTASHRYLNMLAFGTINLGPFYFGPGAAVGYHSGASEPFLAWGAGSIGFDIKPVFIDIRMMFKLGDDNLFQDQYYLLQVGFSFHGGR